MEGLKNKRGPSLWRLLLFVLVLALIAGGTSLFFGGRQDDHSTAMPRFEQYLRTNRIKDARTVYYEELFGDVLLQPEAEEKALAALDQVVEEHRWRGGDLPPQCGEGRTALQRDRPQLYVRRYSC